MDRNFNCGLPLILSYSSLSARRAWIEIRNCSNIFFNCGVALRKESVDRNTYTRTQSASLSAVALRKESVDRNASNSSMLCSAEKSLSARRAWIEILASRLADMSAAVALRKESVDRNVKSSRLQRSIDTSLSARRAWIEIVHRGPYHFYLGVALRKESVDRNIWGGRGTGKTYGSLSARRAWIEISTVIVILRKRNSRSPQGERG